MQRKYKLIAILVIVAMASTAIVYASSYYNTYYVRNLSWTAPATNTNFELFVNGTQQSTQTVNQPIGALGIGASYTEVYTLTNVGNVPITITGDATPEAGSGLVTLNWLTGSTSAITLGPGQSGDMALQLSAFTSSGTVVVTFSSAQALVGDNLQFEFTQTVTNDLDSANNGLWWSLDTFTQSVQVYSAGGDNYVALVSQIGTWNTYAGAQSPGYGVTEPLSGSGPMIGTYEAAFTGTVASNIARGSSFTLATNNCGGTTADIGTQNSATGSQFDWVPTCFAGATDSTVSNALTYWGWLYQSVNFAGYGVNNPQIWINYISANSGDIVT